MSTTAIDTARNTEKLSFFMSKQLSEKPIDNFYTLNPTLDYLFENKKVDNYGRQIMFDVETAEAPNFQWWDGTDTFTTTVKDTVRKAVFALKNCGITINIPWEDQIEAWTSDTRAYDITAQKRDAAEQTIRRRLSQALFNATPGSKEIFSLPKLIDTTSTDVGGINRTTSSYWQANVSTSVGAFSSNGISRMRTQYNNVIRTDMGKPTFYVTTQTIHEAFEAELDPDVRYAQPEKLARGALQLFWKGGEVHFDENCNSGEFYGINTKTLYFIVEQVANMIFDPFKEPVNGKTMTGKIIFRAATIITRPSANFKLTGIS